MKGWVYIITNKAMPGLVKIGYSSKDPDLRAAELNHTGAPFPYLVDYEALVHEPFSIEQRTHKALSHLHKGERYKKGVGIEWFNCSVEEAISAIKIAAGDDLITEEYKCADRAKAEEMYLQKAIKDEEDKARELAETALERQINNEESEILKSYQAKLDFYFAPRPFWMYWLGGAVLCAIAIAILLPKAKDSAVFWISAIGGAAVGAFLQSYFEGKRKGSAEYRAIETQKEAALAEVRLKVIPCQGCDKRYRFERTIDLINRITKSPNKALVCPKCNSKIQFPWPIQNPSS